MSLATRCPQCSTTFRVVSDQLKLRQGLVKCGVCSLVFNGIEQLYYAGSEDGTTEPGNPSQHAPVPDASSPSGEEEHATSAALPAPTEASWDNDSEIAEPLPVVEPLPMVEPLPSADPFSIALPPIPAIEAEDPWRHLPDPRPPWPTLSPELLQGVPPDLPDSAFEFARNTLEENSENASDFSTPSPEREEALPDAAASGEVEAATAPEQQEAEPAHEEAAHVSPDATITRDSVLGPMTMMVLDGKPLDDHALPAFLLDEPPRPRWVTAALVAACVVAVVAFALQLIYQGRSELALQWPQTASVAKSACAMVMQLSEDACTPALPQHIASIRVTSAELQAGATVATDDMRYTLSVSLHNDDALAQAWPALEVMLTNARNQQILRRVIAPEEYLLASTAPETMRARSLKGLAANSEEPITLQLRVRSSEAVVGYAVGAFYP